MRSRILSLTALLLPAALCGTVAADESIDAKRIYQESCSVCHGDDGRGAVWGQTSLAVPPPPSISSPSTSISDGSPTPSPRSWHILRYGIVMGSKPIICAAVESMATTGFARSS